MRSLDAVYVVLNHLQASDVFQYINGTHVGFQDQVVLGNLEVVPDILPWLNPILLFLTYLGFPFATFIAIKLTRLFQPKENGQQDQQQPQSPNLAGRSSSTTGTSSRIVHRAVRTLLLSPGEAALSTRGAQIQAKREAAPQILEAEARKQRQVQWLLCLNVGNTVERHLIGTIANALACMIESLLCLQIDM